MVESDIKAKSTEVIGETFKIDHNFGSGYSLKIIQIDPDTNEKILLEIKTAENVVITFKATITETSIL